VFAAVGLPAAGTARIVAVGDVHGAYTEFISILQKTHLVDRNAQWAGGASLLVPTGDVLDRGPGSRKSMDLLMDLGRQAKSQGGEVIPLLGNHEVLVMIGDLRHVVPEDYRSFATSDSERLREQSYGDCQRFAAAHRAHHHPGLGDDEASRNRWFQEHPPGFFEFRDAFDPQGRYGSWLRTNHGLVVVHRVGRIRRFLGGCQSFGSGGDLAALPGGSNTPDFFVTKTPWERIDLIFFKKLEVVSSVQIGAGLTFPASASDHTGVMTTFQLGRYRQTSPLDEVHGLTIPPRTWRGLKRSKRS